jgi:hypothetical protein
MWWNQPCPQVGLPLPLRFRGGGCALERLWPALDQRVRWVLGPDGLWPCSALCPAQLALSSHAQSNCLKGELPVGSFSSRDSQGIQGETPHPLGCVAAGTQAGRQRRCQRGEPDGHGCACVCARVCMCVLMCACACAHVCMRVCSRV